VAAAVAQVQRALKPVLAALVVLVQAHFLKVLILRAELLLAAAAGIQALAGVLAGAAPAAEVQVALPSMEETAAARMLLAPYPVAVAVEVRALLPVPVVLVLH
jgi:hypothetical protein